MALLIAYTLHDVKALTYSPPFFTTNDQVAKRMVSDLVADNNTMVGRHPSDYKLYKIGTFDEGNAAMMPFSIPEHVLDCVSLVPPPAPSLFTPEQMMSLRMMGGEFRPNGEAK